MVVETGLAGLDWQRDSLWRRLPVTLPGAVLIGLLGLWAGGMFMPGPVQQPIETPALDAQFIELPPPPPPPGLSPIPAWP